jgi:hypothetical protein
MTTYSIKILSAAFALIGIPILTPVKAEYAQPDDGILDPDIAHELVVASRAPWNEHEKAYKDLLNDAWKHLPVKKQKAIEPEQRRWVKWKNSLDEETRIQATEDRAYYIMAIVKGQNPEKTKMDLLAYEMSFLRNLWANISPAQQQQWQQPVDDVLRTPGEWYQKLEAISALNTKIERLQIHK